MKTRDGKFIKEVCVVDLGDSVYRTEVWFADTEEGGPQNAAFSYTDESSSRIILTD